MPAYFTVMKKRLLFFVAFVTLFAYTFFSCKQEKAVPEKEIAQTLLLQVNQFAAAKDSLLHAVETGTANEQQLQHLFLETRMAYKKMEWATEYFAPVISRFVNGPPVEEVESGNGQVFQPAGLQVMESYLFPKYDTSKKQALIQQLQLLQNGCDKYKTYFANISILDWQVFDATKLEVFRILTLGITGFDNPLTQKSMLESAASMESVQQVLHYYGAENDVQHLNNAFGAAVKYLKQNPDFNTFDRAAFITQFANPITTDISNLEQKLNIKVTTYNRLLRQDAKTLFDTNAFNVNAYTPDFSSFATEQKIALGKALFADNTLSGNNTRSCQSCHQPDKAFTDGLVTNTVINSSEHLPRNTPTLLNAALQPAQFDDIRAITLEEQSLNVVQNKNEMHGSMKTAADKLWKLAAYRKMFSDAFPSRNRKGIDTLEIMNAIGSYVRSLTFMNSRFDAYMRGNKTVLNTAEINGFNLFMGKAKCATCHYMPLFNGTLPPRYMRIETEVIGVPQTKDGKTLDPDMGRYAIIPVASLKHSFKIVTVRNAARTAPYMHNGVFSTLEEVIEFYNKGGGTGLGLKVENQTLPFDKLNLSTQEKQEIIAFMKSLDSK
jgi:cytochrome c peroxidase